ncbi:MAG: uroporphyrinogen decarboxylase family protein [Eubacteriales bacterium]|nr:uroporphyrinogen decarboxylase family protein [Eubacteriales bacterium]NCU25165.1 methylcobamide--CoM methyltransferase [Candidatus Nomurabacteria bacterium]
MQTNMRKWMFLQSTSVERIAMPIMTYPGLSLAGTNVLEVVKYGEAQFRCMEALADMFPSAAANTVMDLSVEAEAFGSPVNFSEEEIPTVSAPIINELEEIASVKIPKVGDARTGSYITAAKMSARYIKDRPTFGGEIGPFSLAGRLMDMSELMISMMTDPEPVSLLLEKITTFLIDYAKAFKAVGANGIIIAEPAAGLLSPEHCEEFSSRHIRRIVEEVQDDYFMVILHNCGNTTNLVSSMIGTGAMALHFGNAVDMTAIMPQIPWGRIAFGNLDPVSVFKNASHEDVRVKTWELLEKTFSYKNFILSSGCDIPPGTPVENIEAFFEKLEEFNDAMMRSIRR